MEEIIFALPALTDEDIKEIKAKKIPKVSSRRAVIESSNSKGPTIPSFVSDEAQDVIDKRKAKFQTSDESVQLMLQADKDSLKRNNKRKSTAVDDTQQKKKKGGVAEAKNSSSKVSDDVKKKREEKFK